MQKEKREHFHYSNKTIRIADGTWEKLKSKRRQSGKTWNLYLLGLLKHYEHRKNKNDWSGSALSLLRHPSNKTSSSEETTGWAQVLLWVFLTVSRVQKELPRRISKKILVEKTPRAEGIPATFAGAAQKTGATRKWFSANYGQQRRGNTLSIPFCITPLNSCNTPLIGLRQKNYPRRGNWAVNDV